MKTIIESLTIKLYARYFLTKETLENKREPVKDELHTLYIKILKKLLSDSHLQVTDTNHYLSETKKYWSNKQSDLELEKKRIYDRTLLVKKEKEEIINDENWNIYMHSIINIPKNTDLTDTIRNVEQIVIEEIHKPKQENLEIALYHLNSLGGVGNEDTLSYKELELLEIPLKEDPEEFIKLPPVVQKKYFWEQLKMALY